MSREEENLIITELNKNLEKISAVVVKIKSDYHELCILKDIRIADLEQENKELKDKLNNLSSVAEVRLANWQKYEKENAELKELIEDIYDLIPSSHSDYYKDVMERAKQFLKE